MSSNYEIDQMYILYSKFSAPCKQILDLYNPRARDLPHLKMVCIDNQEMRSFLHSSSLNIKTVPCVLFIYKNFKIEKLEHSNIVQWLINHISQHGVSDLPRTSVDTLIDAPLPLPAKTPVAPAKTPEPPSIQNIDRYSTPPQNQPTNPINPPDTIPLQTQLKGQQFHQYDNQVFKQPVENPYPSIPISESDQKEYTPQSLNKIGSIGIATTSIEDLDRSIPPNSVVASRNTAKNIANEMEAARSKIDAEVFPHRNQFEQGFGLK